MWTRDFSGQFLFWGLGVGELEGGGEGEWGGGGFHRLLEILLYCATVKHIQTAATLAGPRLVVWCVTRIT